MLTDKHVSRLHASIQENEQGYTLTDLGTTAKGSTNGTKLNRRVLRDNKPVALEYGDIIKLGPSTALLFDKITP